LAPGIQMNSESEFKVFYESVLNSFEEQKVPSVDDNFFRVQGGQAEDFTGSMSYTRIMVSSWTEFLNNLFLHTSAENLLSNLNNHLSFIKRLDLKSQSFHLHYFRQICAALFHYLIRRKIIINTHFEIEEDYKTFELDLFLLRNQTNLADLVFYILAKDFAEINVTTEKHIIEVLRAIKSKDQVQFNQNFNQLRAIQETILTILQLDRKEQKSPLVRKLQKEFDLINHFCLLIQKISENSVYNILNENKLEFRSSYDYPFLDVLKNLGKWYQKRETKYLKNAKEIFGFIHSKNPFRKEDMEFFSKIETSILITDDYRFITQGEPEKFLDPFWEYLNNPGISWIFKKAILDFLIHIMQVRSSFETNLQQVLEFFFRLFDDQNITLIYRRQIFVNIALMTQAWIKAGMISPAQAKTVVTELVRIDKNLKKQPLKKMGNFVRISYEMKPDLILSEFEKGLCVHLLYALEDFLDWTEGRSLRQLLSRSTLNKNPRYLIFDNLYRIAGEISQSKKPEEEISEDIKTKSALIKGFCKRILDDYFKLLPELFQSIYSAFIIHIVHLASQVEKILPEDRDWLLDKFAEMKRNLYKQLNFPLLQYSASQVSNELYEKELSSIISILHLYVPMA